MWSRRRPAWDREQNRCADDHFSPQTVGHHVKVRPQCERKQHVKQIFQENVLLCLVFSRSVKSVCVGGTSAFSKFSASMLRVFALSLSLPFFLSKPAHNLQSFFLYPFGFPQQIAVVPGYFVSPEEMSVSVAEVEYGVQIHKPKHHEQEKTGNGLFKV